MSEMMVRAARASDLEALADIYNHYVVHTAVTFDLEPISYGERREWMSHYAERGPHRLMVAEEEGRIAGYATSSRLRPKGAYRKSVETSLYLEPSSTGRGIGKRLYAVLFEALAAERVHRAYAGVTLPNPASIALHRSFGFRELGLYHEVGHKLGRFWSVLWFEKRFEDDPAARGRSGGSRTIRRTGDDPAARTAARS